MSSILEANASLIEADTKLIQFIENLEVHTEKPNYLRVLNILTKARNEYFAYMSKLIRENKSLEALLKDSVSRERPQCSHMFECSECTIPRVRNYSYR